MKKFTPRQYLFLFTYPLAHLAVIALCFLASDLLGERNSHVTDVLFMAALLLIAPVLAFPRTLEEINIMFSGWHPLLVLALVYTVVFLFYALPFVLLYKKIKKR